MTVRARPLTVLSVAYAMAPTGPDAVGGAEQVLFMLDHALVAAGHRSLVVACDGSVIAGRHLAFPALHGAIDDEARQAMQGWVRRRVAEALAAEPVDIVHMHGLDALECLPPPGVPVLITLHLPPAWYPAALLSPARPGTYIHGVSSHQASLIPPGPAVLPPIANGVDVTLLGAMRPRRCSYALVLARVCPEKGLHLALDAAHAVNSRLLLAGEVFPYAAHQAYFREQVEPRLDARRRYVGPAGFARKRRLLAAARCVLLPSLAPETSSLVAMEAASCGTPVIGFRAGAVPEVVEDGRTGFLVEDVAALAAAIGRAGEIDPETCRATARRRFDRRRMEAAYLARYAMLAGQSARAAA